MIVSFSHHKGGTGKTTSCINVAGFAALRSAKALVVDLDPQANATSGLGIDASTLERSMVDVFLGEAAMQDIIVDTECGVHVAPATLDLVGAEPWLYGLDVGRLVQLRDALKPVASNYDVILVDTPPGAGILMLNGLAAAQRIVVTFDPGIFALEDLESFQTILKETSEHAGVAPVADVAIITRVVAARLLDRLMRRADPVREMVSDLRPRFRSGFLIPHDRHVFESHRRGLPLSHLAPESAAGKGYRLLTDELLTRPVQDVKHHG